VTEREKQLLKENAGLKLRLEEAEEKLDAIRNAEVEKQLLKSQESLKEAQRLSHLGSWEYDILTETVIWSENLYTVFGKDPTTFTPTLNDFYGIIVQEDRETVRTLINDAIEKGMPYAAEYRIKLPGEEIRYIQSRGKVVTDQGGRIVLVFGTSQDITEQRLAASAMQNTLQRFYLILESMYASVLLMTDDGRVEFLNQAFCENFGLNEAPAELVGTSSMEFLKKIRLSYRDPDEAERRIREILGKMQPVLGEEFAMRGGRTGLRDFVPLKINGRSAGRLWIHTDITNLKKTEERLRNSEERFRTITENAPMLIGISSLKDGTILFTNPTYNSTLGYKEGELIGMKGPELYVDRAERKILLGLFHSQGFVSNFRVQVRRKDGSPIWLLSSVHPVNYNGIPSIIGASVDITELMKAEADLKAANDELYLFNRTMVGRELRMIELKKEINQLCIAAGMPSKYEVDEEEVKK
jgi:PAS domain S-box-containing protein